MAHKSIDTTRPILLYVSLSRAAFCGIRRETTTKISNSHFFAFYRNIGPFRHSLLQSMRVLVSWEMAQEEDPWSLRRERGKLARIWSSSWPIRLLKLGASSPIMPPAIMECFTEQESMLFLRMEISNMGYLGSGRFWVHLPALERVWKTVL